MIQIVSLLFFVLTPGSEPLVLDESEVVCRIQEVSRAVAAADYREEAALGAALAADAAVLPTVSVSSGMTYRSSVPSFELPIPGSPLTLNPDIRDVYKNEIRMQQLIYSGGAVTASRRAARFELDAAEHAGARVRGELRLAARMAYWDAVRTGAAVSAADAQYRRAQRLHSDATAYCDAGMATAADLAAAEERVASTRVRLVDARARYENARSRIRSLLNLDQSMDFTLSDSLSGPFSLVQDSLELLQMRALENRPELLETLSRGNALAERRAVASAGSRPSLIAVAQWEYGRPNQRYFPAEDAWNDSWSLSLLGTWSIFDGGSARREARSIQAAASAAREDREELRRMILLEVEVAYRTLSSALASVVASETALEAARERYRQVSLQYASGVASTTELLDAQVQLSVVENMVIDTRSGVWMAAAQLDRAVGD